MAKIKLKGKFGKIVSVALAATLVFGVVALVSSITGRETTSVKSYEFARGDINDQGEYIETNTAIYTKDLIECQGLTVTPDFEADSTYKVVFYNIDGAYYGSTVSCAKGEVFTSDKVPGGAKYARIVIYPNQLDSDGKAIKDFKIKFYEVYDYANDFDIKVNKDQTMTDMIERAKTLAFESGLNYSDLLSKDNLYITNSVFNANDGEGMNDIGESVLYDTFIINASSLKSLRVERYDETNARLYSYSFDVNMNNLVGGFTNFTEGLSAKVVELIDGTKYVVFDIDHNVECRIFENTVK